MTYPLCTTDIWPTLLSHTPVREVVAPTGTIIRGLFPSTKAKRMVSFEQLLERDALYLFEFARQVADIQEQPFKLKYKMGNKVRRYTPDYALILVDGSILIVEVKPARSLAKPEVHEKLLHVREAMYRQGHQYLVLSSDTIRSPHRLDNLKKLHRYLRQPLSGVDLMVHRQLKSLLSLECAVPLCQLEALRGSSEPVMRLLAHGLLSCDLDHLITPDTRITLTKQEADYVFVDSL
ncbi:TnsA endonuclease N-terminal domain-containing protein [Chromobacterium haemolyticum]|uniref:TnsA endonuclease N-terminal domain-containing protein n=1 Tax=Chromobacterium haemolyticum TaxID=394935 RepID=UPI001746F97D|nr:TnsA endonuclease N-terminal domain-containing protein [Chromobacterium haemolyticum]QOD82933.1 TnsA endonuclease N-terminal domain-containing protein [Chromobacterium haemolyticum]